MEELTEYRKMQNYQKVKLFNDLTEFILKMEKEGINLGFKLGIEWNKNTRRVYSDE